MIRTRFRPALALAAAATALLAACGGGSSGGDDTVAPPPTTYTATSGVAQKGPLAAGSAVTLKSLGLNLAAIGPEQDVTTDSDLGTFTPSGSFTTPWVGVSATGFYFDEVAGSPSAAPITLQSYADLSAEATLNANLLTTLASTRIARLVNQDGLDFAAARMQAEAEVLAAFGIATSPAIAHFGTLDIADAGATGAATDGDRVLAALSSVIVQGRAAADVGALIAQLQADLGANGAITDPAVRQSLADSAQALDLNRVVVNLNHVYATIGTTLAADGLAPWLDRNGDGVVGHDEFRVDDAAPSASFTLPAEFSTAHAGATLFASGAALWINGVPTAAAMLHAGDVVALVAPATLADGVLDAYVKSGTTPIARVSFVKGLASIAVTPVSAGLPIGLAQRFVATGTFDDGHSADVSTSVTWSSDAPASAAIDAGNGLADALAIGRATITASSGRVAGSTSLDVVVAAIQSIAIAPTTLVTGVGISRPLVAMGTFSDGSVADVTASVAWQSGAASTATVVRGRVKGVALGTTTATATLAGVTASVDVSVTADIWSPAQAMPTSRVAGASVTPMPDGSVLVIGGATSLATGSTAVDVFNTSTLTWARGGVDAPMATARSSHTATLLADGRVLVVGGSTLTGNVAKGYVNNASAEIYDPVANTWTSAASLHAARAHHTATLLASGKVLVTGGEDDRYQVVDSAETWDPATDTWTVTARPLGAARSTHTATRLSNGRVLIAGGFDIETGVLTALASAELYDPATDTFLPVASMNVPHRGHTATTLQDGRILVAAGGNALAEIFDPAHGTWTTTPALDASRSTAAATLRPDGRLIVAGGTRATPNAERYDPVADGWTPAASMAVNRDAPIAALLRDGSVLVCGGAPDAASTSCEIYW